MALGTPRLRGKFFTRRNPVSDPGSIRGIVQRRASDKVLVGVEEWGCQEASNLANVAASASEGPVRRTVTDL